MASIRARLRRSIGSFRVTPFVAWVGGLGVVLLVGVSAGLIVFVKGLSVTHLNDLVPWGLWITMDLSSIALSAGAFLLCAAVYLLGLRQLQPVARTATYVGLIGYSMALLALIMDIGRPDRFWHSIVFWNPHSVMWEVTMCILVYFTVLMLEAAPILGSAAWFRARWPRLAGRLQGVHHLAPVLAIVGFVSLALAPVLSWGRLWRAQGPPHLVSSGFVGALHRLRDRRRPVAGGVDFHDRCAPFEKGVCG